MTSPRPSSTGCLRTVACCSSTAPRIAPGILIFPPKTFRMAFTNRPEFLEISRQNFRNPQHSERTLFTVVQVQFVRAADPVRQLLEARDG